MKLAPPAAELAAAVTERELLRLLGLPRGRALEGDLRARAEGARTSYAGHGRPFAAARRVGLAELSLSTVGLEDGTELRSPALAEALQAASGHAVIVLAVSAGREVTADASRLWTAERPDEAYFLDRFAAAATEALLLQASGALCRAASRDGETLLPPLSPGCGRFELGDQQRLMHVLGAAPVGDERLGLGPIELLPSGALDPPHSLLAAIGVTRQSRAAATPEDLCRGCELDRCGFRRAPFSGTPRADAAAAGSDAR